MNKNNIQEPFDVQDWMETYHRKKGEDWEKWNGKPEQEYCDLRLKDGREIGPCWPTVRSVFVDLASEEEDRIPFSDVKYIRYYEIGLAVKDEEDEQTEEEN